MRLKSIYKRVRVITHTDSSGRVWFLTSFVCLSAFLHDISKTDAAKFTKLYTEMFHDESWKSTYFGVKRSKVKVTSHKTIDGVGVCTLVSAGFF